MEENKTNETPNREEHAKREREAHLDTLLFSDVESRPEILQALHFATVQS